MNNSTISRTQEFLKTREEPEGFDGRKRRKRDERKTWAAPSSWGSRMLSALQSKPLYQGIDEEDLAAVNRLAKRRRKNRLAKASRKANRR